MAEKNMWELSTDEMDQVSGGDSDFSQEVVDKLALLSKMESKTELVDFIEGSCPKCEKKIVEIK